MKFAPKKESEVNQNTLLPNGIYDFEIVEAEDKISTAGNPMIKLKLSVFDAQGKRHTVFDYLMEKLAYKLRHAAYACGQGAKYESGEIDSLDFTGQAGKLKLKIEVSKDPAYQDKNVVADYVVPGGTESEKRKAKEDKEALDHELIPF